MRFKILAGGHVDGGIVKGKDQIVESDSDLDKLFPGCYERVGDEVRIPNPPAAKAVKAKEPEAEEDAIDLGKDVTKTFADAAEKGLKVFKRGMQYFVYEADDMEEPINPQPLDKPQVSKFLKKC